MPVLPLGGTTHLDKSKPAAPADPREGKVANSDSLFTNSFCI